MCYQKSCPQLHAQCLRCMVGVELRASCLHGKHFTDWVVTPVLSVCMFELSCTCMKMHLTSQSKQHPLYDKLPFCPFISTVLCGHLPSLEWFLCPLRFLYGFIVLAIYILSLQWHPHILYLEAQRAGLSSFLVCPEKLAHVVWLNKPSFIFSNRSLCVTGLFPLCRVQGRVQPLMMMVLLIAPDIPCLEAEFVPFLPLSPGGFSVLEYFLPDIY